MRKDSVCCYVLLSLAFIVINVITLSNLPPWIDEVMMLDTSYNTAVHSSWSTTAWYRVVGQYPFSTYPPLYQILATVWIWIFGGSLVAARSLNLLIVFVLGIACLRLMRRHVELLTPAVVVLFTVLLWGTSEMAWMYRNGRPDLLCALMFVFTVHAMMARNRVAVIATSALLMCSGLQAAVYVCIFWLFLFIVMKNRRKEMLRLLVTLLTGLLLGLLLVSLFMLAHGRLMAFASSIIQYSTTLSGLALTVLPLAGDVLNFDATPYTQKLLELTTSSDNAQGLFGTIMAYRSFVMLSAVALVAYAITFRHRLYGILSDWGFLLLLFALCVPVFMNLAGRFAIYYRWMAYLPLLIAVTTIAARRRGWLVVFGAVAAVLTFFGIKSMRAGDDWNYANVRSFVQRQHFKTSDAVVCPFTVFYEMKPVCDTCYFAGIFPTEFIGHVDYIIEAADGGEFDRPITDYVNRLRADTTVVLTAIDHCEHPSLTLYHVEPE